MEGLWKSVLLKGEGGGEVDTATKASELPRVPSQRFQVIKPCGCFLTSHARCDLTMCFV